MWFERVHMIERKKKKYQYKENETHVQKKHRTTHRILVCIKGVVTRDPPAERRLPSVSPSLPLFLSSSKVETIDLHFSLLPSFNPFFARSTTRIRRAMSSYDAEERRLGYGHTDVGFGTSSAFGGGEDEDGALGEGPGARDVGC